MDFSRIILGVDPGTQIMGFGVIGIRENKMELLDLGILKLPATDDHALKLQKIFKFTDELIRRWKPDELAAEAPFFGKNVQSMLKLGRAQGVVLAAALSKEIPVREYSPRSIKQSITGRGGASKEQVAKMLQGLLVIPNNKMPQYLDATDGLAVAVCHYFQSGKPTEQVKSVKPKSGKKASSWANFIHQNPDRVREK
jgi:crossover junction endodeoxyribonuclease RuvC